MNDSKTAAFGLRAPFCQKLANTGQGHLAAPLSDERAHLQLTEIDTRADNPALKCVTRSRIAVHFSTSQVCATVAHKLNQWRNQGGWV